jgi:hypothetical protein
LLQQSCRNNHAGMRRHAMITRPVLATAEQARSFARKELAARRCRAFRPEMFVS